MICIQKSLIFQCEKREISQGVPDLRYWIIGLTTAIILVLLSVSSSCRAAVDSGGALWWSVFFIEGMVIHRYEEGLSRAQDGVFKEWLSVQPTE